MILKEYFDRIAIVHLRERVDRYATLKRELGLLSIDIADRKFQYLKHQSRQRQMGLPQKEFTAVFSAI